MHVGRAGCPICRGFMDYTQYTDTQTYVRTLQLILMVSPIEVRGSGACIRMHRDAR